MGRYALLIGNSQYDDPDIGQLALPEADVEAVASVLGDPDIGGYEIVDTLINQTESLARRAISKFFKGRSTDDFLLLYFAGHGLKDKSGALHLAFPDTEIRYLDATALPDRFVATQMDRSRSEKQLVMLDCCYAAAFGSGSRSAIGEPVGLEQEYEQVLNDPRGVGRWVLAATGSIQYAWEGGSIVGEASNSLFTRFLIEGLQTGEADENGDGVITIQELHNYIYRQVRAIEPDQNPELHARPNASLGALIIANSRLLSMVPPEVQQAFDALPNPPREGLRDTNEWTRYYAIGEAERGLPDSVLGSSYDVVLRYLAEHDIEQRVRERAGQALDNFAQAEQQRFEAEQRQQDEEARRAAEREQERIRLQQEIESQLGAQAAAFIQRVNALYEEAEGYFSHSQWEDAETALEQMSDLSPDDPRINDLYRRIETARAEEAERARQQARQQQIEKLMAEAQQEAGSRRWSNAEALLDQVLGMEPGYPPALALAEEIAEIRAQRDPVLDVLPQPFEWCEIPAGRVEINGTTFDVQPFLMAKHAITYEQYQVFLDDPDGFRNDQWWQGLAKHESSPGTQRFTHAENLPRENVSWYDAVAFCRWLSSRVGYEVRLPTEWEWQWAVVGDTGWDYPYGDTFDKNRCNTRDSGHRKTVPVTEYPQGASPYGVLNMSGNVWEWCLNESSTPANTGLGGGERRVVRGGSWFNGQVYARASNRYDRGPYYRSNYFGFRLVVVVPPSKP